MLFRSEIIKESILGKRPNTLRAVGRDLLVAPVGKSFRRRRKKAGLARERRWRVLRLGGRQSAVEMGMAEMAMSRAGNRGWRVGSRNDCWLIFVWLTGRPYLSEARAGQCSTTRRQPPTLEALLAVPDRFWDGQSLYDPTVWPVFLSGAPMEL